MKVGNLAFGLVLAAFAVWPITAQQQSVPAAQPSRAQIHEDASRIADFGSDLHIELALSQPVPWQVFTLDAPRRLVMDFGEVDFEGRDLAALVHSDVVSGLRMGPFQEGWSRMVIELAEPLRIDTAALAPVTGSGLVALKLQLAPTDEADFASHAGPPGSVQFALPEAAPEPEAAADRPLRVALDAGHGGLDHGVEAGGLTEAAAILGFTRELRDVLETRGMEVVMVREGDVYMPTASRLDIATKADVFLSIHAGILSQDAESGATIYTLAAEASDDETARLASAHDHADLLAGSDWDEARLPAAAPLVRARTARRSEALADALVLSLARHTGDLRKRPLRRADFSILRAPQTPSVLVELGLLSSPGDRANLRSESWRSRAVLAICESIERWAEADEADGRRPG